MTTIHFSKRLVNYTRLATGSDVKKPISDDPVTLFFSDGTRATCDVLIGADGIHSATRNSLLGCLASEALAAGDALRAELLMNKSDPVWSGTVAYRGVIPRAHLEKINANHRALNVPQKVRI